MSTLVYRYGLHAPHEGADLVREQMRESTRYRNDLVEIERWRRDRVREFELKAGDLPVAMRALEAAQAIEHEAYVAVARHRAKSRKRDEPRALKDALKAARAAVRTAADHTHTVRAAIKADPRAQAAKDLIGERAKRFAKNAYERSLLFWGQRALCDEEAAASFSSLPMYDRDWQPNGPRRAFFDGAGAVGLQIMGGLSVEEVHGCADNRLRLVPPDPRAWSGARSDRRRYGSTAELWLRVGSEGRNPVWAKWTCDMDRPLPEGVRVIWAAVHRRMRGPHSEWSLSLTLDVPAGAYARRSGPPKRGGAVAVDVGWRVVGAELRVAGWADEHGNKGELRLTAADLCALRQPTEIAQGRSLRFDSARAAFAAVLRGLGDGVPEWLAAKTWSLSAWKSEARLAALCLDWPTESQGVVLDAAYRDLCAWYYPDRHAWETESAARVQSLRRRREVYRIFAAWLADHYDTIVIEAFDKRDVAKRPVLGADDDKVQNETARGNRQLASPSELCGSITKAARSRARTCAAMPCADTTRTCPVCGLVTKRDAEADVTISCECGHVWDQDVAGAPFVLLARWRERPGDAKILEGARDGGKENESANKKTSRRERVKALRRAKEERMQVAREAFPDLAESLES
jgi:hypothetical protein